MPFQVRQLTTQITYRSTNLHSQQADFQCGAGKSCEEEHNFTIFLRHKLHCQLWTPDKAGHLRGV